ncbi:MAG: metallopeptidase [Myxococcaceae bacterium]|nr:metallopeptidase [Myxococcaceae bacterium]
MFRRAPSLSTAAGWVCVGLLVSLACRPVQAQLPGSPAASGAASAPSPQRYELTAKLDPALHRVEGTARITFTNTSEAVLEELVFHLYLNAFRDRESVFMRESRGSLRGVRVRGAGSIKLETLTVNAEDALARSERELIAHDFTQLRTSLATPLRPGQSVIIETRFVATLPPIFARSGYSRDFFAVAQWFPKLAKLEPDGHFASFPYHSLGEFYADFADYVLHVDTPADLAVLASGVLAYEKRAGTRLVRRFDAARVHDLAFVAARGFRSDVESVDGVLVRYLSPPGYEGALHEHAAVVRAGLAHYGRAFGAYPYPSLSVVVPPRGAEGAQGMEYPTLIMTGGPWYDVPGLPSLAGSIVTAHELAHQWFYGLLGSNEVRYPVLDEGLTEWASLDLMRTMYGGREGLGGLALDRFELERLFATRLTQSTSPGLPVYAYAPAEYAASVYARAALALESIRRAHGRERFDRALSIYAISQRYQHPTPRDLEHAFDAAYGAGFAETTLRPLLFEGESSAVRLVSARSELGDDDEHLLHVFARRSGKVSLPTWLALYAADGHELSRTRFAAEQDTLAVTLQTEQPVARVVLDPERALLLDADAAHHVMQLAPPSTMSPLARVLAFAQLLASWAGP